MVARTDPKLVDMTTEATTSLVLASATSELGVRVKVTARESSDAVRPPLDLALVLDTSGSMEGDAIEAVRASAKQVIDKMRDGDRISLVAFHSKAEVLVPNTRLDAASRRHVLDAIARIAARGTTDLTDGLAVGYQQLAAGQFPNGINRIVLLSDGVPNTAAQLPSLISQVHAAGYSITTLGMGIDYDTTVMTELARATGGSFHYIDKPDEVADVFDGELTKMTTVVARNMTLVVAPGPGVTIEPMQGLTAAGDGKVYATLGDLAAGESRDLMIPIKVSARAEHATVELVDTALTFDDVVGQSGQQHRDGFVAVKASKDPVALKDAIKIDLERSRMRATAASAILEAMQLARAGQLEQAKSRISQARAAVIRFKDATLDPLVKELDDVAKQIVKMAVPVAQPIAGAAPKLPAVAPEEDERPMRRAEEKAEAITTGRAR